MPSSWRCAAAVAAMLLPLLAAAADPATQPLTVTAQPRHMRLAEGGRARVRVAAAQRPVMSVSVGRLEGLHEIASGLYEAEFIPPDSVDPEVVIVTASSQGRFGWAPIVLAGVREVEVRAPHRTLVAVNVGGDSFGPIPADGTGKAVLRVDVPPGVGFATSRGARIRLDVPQRGYVHVAVENPELDANATQAVKVRVVVLDEGGAPVRKPQVKLEVSEGSLGSVVQVAPGVLEAGWKVGPGRVRVAKITAKVGSKPSSSAVATLRRVAGEPVAVHVDVDREKLVAGESDELVVTARVVDRAGSLTDAPAKLLVSLKTGGVERLLQDAILEWQSSDGVNTGRVLVPRRRSGTQELELKVIAPNGLVGTRSVFLVPGPAAALSVETDDVVYADGRSHQLRVVLLDMYGNHTDGQGTAQVTAARGSVGAPTRAGAGVYVVDYRSPLRSADYSDVISARVGPLEGKTELRVRARGSRVVLGVKGGYAVGTGSLSSPEGGVEIGFWRPSFNSSLGLVLEARYFSFGRDETLTAGSISLPVSSTASFLAIEPSIGWRRPLVGGMLWLGAGPGIARTSTTVAARGQEDLTTSQWVLSAHGSAGWGYPLGPGIPFAELKAGWHGESDGPVTGSLQTLTVNVGYRFDVF